MADPSTDSLNAPRKGANSGLKRILHAMGYSLEGIGSTLKHEEAFRQEMILAALLVPVAFFMPVTVAAKALLILAVFLVLIVELLNSALEWTVDYISTQPHPLAKRIKDMASAAVLLSLVHFAVVWGLIVVDNWSAIRAAWFG